MNLAKSRKAGVCPAMRCKAPSTDVPSVVNGETVYLCERHTKEARAEEHEGHSPIEMLTDEQIEEIETELENQRALGHTREQSIENMREDWPQLDDKTLGEWYDSLGEDAPPPTPKPEIVETATVPTEAEAKASVDNADAIATEALESLPEIQALQIEDHDDYAFIEGLAVEAKKNLKDLETERTSITKPLNEALRKVNEKFKPAKDALQKIERICKTKLKLARQRFEEEAERKLEEAKATDDLEEKHEAMVRAAEAVPETGRVTFRDNWKGEIYDETQIPTRYWVIDIDRINKEIKAAKGEIEIPGVRVVNDKIEVIRWP